MTMKYKQRRSVRERDRRTEETAQSRNPKRNDSKTIPATLDLGFAPNGRALTMLDLHVKPISTTSKKKKPARAARPLDAIARPKKRVKKPSTANNAFNALTPGATFKTEQAATLGNGRKVGIAGMRDENGERFVVCREGSRSAVMRYDAWHGAGSEASAALRRAGIVIVGGMGAVRDGVDLLKKFPPAAIVSKPGWTTHGFALCDGRVLRPAGRPEPWKAFMEISGILGHAGTLEGWRERVAAPLADHALAAFGMMIMFAAPLLRFINRADNVGFELSGQAGTGKSTLQFLMASAAGATVGDEGSTYWRTLNTTMNALETVISAYADMPLILDEAGLVDGGGKAESRALAMRDLAFRLSAGQVKHRLGKQTGPRSRLVYVISTNRPIASLLGSAHAMENEAIADRLITLPLLPDRPHGIFDHCPPSYASTGAFAEALKQAASENYGHALPAFLQYMAGRVARQPKGTRARIKGYIDHFVKRSGTNPNNGSQLRVAEAIGLVYAGGKLAKTAGVLPSTYRCLAAALAALALHRKDGRATISFDDRLQTLMTHPNTIDLAKVDFAALDPAARDRCMAFLYTGRSGQRELLVPIRYADHVFPGWKGLIDDPEVTQRLKPIKGRKACDRPVGPDQALVPVYSFDITGLE